MADIVGIVDEFGTIWRGEPGASERIGDLVQRADQETFEVRLTSESGLRKALRDILLVESGRSLRHRMDNEEMWQAMTDIARAALEAHRVTGREQPTDGGRPSLFPSLHSCVSGPVGVESGQEANRPGDATNAPGHDTEGGSSMPDKFTALPMNGQRIRVTGVNLCMQVLPPFEGVVTGVEFRCDPPIVSVEGNGKRRDIDNFGNGSTWEPLAEDDGDALDEAIYEQSLFAALHLRRKPERPKLRICTCNGWLDGVPLPPKTDCPNCHGTGQREVFEHRAARARDWRSSWWLVVLCVALVAAGVLYQLVR